METAAHAIPAIDDNDVATAPAKRRIAMAAITRQMESPIRYGAPMNGETGWPLVIRLGPVINLSDDEIRIYDRKEKGSCERFSGSVVSGAYGRFFVIDTAENR